MVRFFIFFSFIVILCRAPAQEPVYQTSDLMEMPHFQDLKPMEVQHKINHQHILILKKLDFFIKQGVPAIALRRAFEFFFQTYGKTLRVKATDQMTTLNFKNDRYLGIVDYTQPSTEKRFYLLNLKTGEVEKHYVSHGRFSGFNWAQSFSNDLDSQKSSLGIFITGEIYKSRTFQSPAMKVYGLEATNFNAFSRSIVIHQADYASPQFIENLKQKFQQTNEKKYSPRLGRSLGCFAFDPEVAQQIIQKLRGGALIYSYVKGAEKHILESAQHQNIIRIDPSLDPGEDTEEELLQITKDNKNK